MKKSPGGRDIEKLSGDAWDIQQRGKDMESLGMQMRESAALLKKIADGTEGKGYSVEVIKDSVGDVHEDLRKAGERYEPSGTAIRHYGEALASVKYKINTIVDDCEELWAIYVAASGDVADASNQSVPDDETPEQKTAREDAAEELAGSKATAYANWLEEATKYDAPYETWDAAYDAAYEGLKDANDDGVEDRWWDNALPFIEAALVVLAVAGIVLAVLAIVIGGPIIALLAAVVAIATLALTIWKVAAGRGGAADIAWAVVGVIPFGRLAQLGGAFKSMKAFGSFMKGFGGDMIGATGIAQMMTARGLPALIGRTSIFNSINRASSPANLARIADLGSDISKLKFTSINPTAMLQRLTGGTSGSFAAGMADAFGDARPYIGNMVDNLLDGSSLHGLQNASSAGETVLNVIDSVVKPGREGTVFVMDETANDPTSTWERELANS